MSGNILNKEAYKIFVAWLTLGILWGATFVATNIGVNNLPSLLMGGVRFLMAGATALLFTVIRKEPAGISKKQMINSAIMGLFMFGFGNGFVNIAQNYVSASITSIVLATPPIMVSLIDSYLPNGIRLYKKGWAGLFICLFAIVWMWLPEVKDGSGSWLSLLILMGSSVFWALGILYGRHNERIHNKWADVSVQCFTAGIFQITAGTGMGMWGGWHNNLSGWLAILFLAFIGTIIGNWCLVYIIDRMPPAKVSTYAYVNIVSAMFLGWVILHEIITVRMILAAILIIIGVILSQSSKVKEVKKSKTENGELSVNNKSS